MITNENKILDMLTVITADIAVLKSDVSELKSDVSELKSDMVAVKSDIAELKTLVPTVAKLHIDVVGLKVSTAKLQDSVDYLLFGLDEVIRDVGHSRDEFKKHLKERHLSAIMEKEVAYKAD